MEMQQPVDLQKQLQAILKPKLKHGNEKEESVRLVQLDRLYLGAKLIKRTKVTREEYEKRLSHYQICLKVKNNAKVQHHSAKDWHI